MSDDDTPVPDAAHAASLPHGLVQRHDGVFFDLSLAPAQLRAAVGQLFLSGQLLAGLDYPLFLLTLFHAPVPRAAPKGDALLRVAARVAPFPAARRALYKQVKIRGDVAEFYFEALAADADGQVPARREFDELVADLWGKGVLYGLDSVAVRAILDTGKAERITVARALPPQPGRDAQLVEVSQGIHRDDAPRERPDGRLDLLSFKNRFPQVKKHARLLRLLPGAPGQPGYDLAGNVLPPPAPLELDLAAAAGVGTVAEHFSDGDFIVATLDGYVNVDEQGKISVENKIVSREGVSSRTTGNLKLRAAYEEYGEVQEQRQLDGSDITIHGDVYGHLHSHGGLILLHRNLVGGTAFNEHGDVRIEGVASGSVVQSLSGEVHLRRAESCVIAGTRVVIDHASNCEIIADDVVIELAEGCAVAARTIKVGSAGPRKQVEMLLFPLVPDLSSLEQKIADSLARGAQYLQMRDKRQQEIDAIAQLPEVRNYLTLAGQLRRGELQLQPAQQLQYDKLAARIAPVLKEVARLRVEVKQSEILQAQMLALVEQLRQERQAMAGQSRCTLGLVDGETTVRSLVVPRGPAKVYDRPPKEIKALLRSATPATQLVFADSTGTLDWTYAPPPGG
ncbi:FapA family protein [Janthinobacterium sp. SUN118]|uniref:flagellar assembly protein A n=1 Tax=Janthinobacterium sp. SUN118 TaxID=3004100 RepID=UPI0025AFB0AB|nr:flagellar assembly protein A [Janthinobacterium sp. SUN118]MDN2709238.1 FapA family protein [Janthinobacterium sp. SUN118]